MHQARGPLRYPGWLRRNHRLASVGTGGWVQSESPAAFIGIRKAQRQFMREHTRALLQGTGSRVGTLGAPPDATIAQKGRRGRFPRARHPERADACPHRGALTTKSRPGGVSGRPQWREKEKAQ